MWLEKKKKQFSGPTRSQTIARIPMENVVPLTVSTRSLLFYCGTNKLIAGPIKPGEKQFNSFSTSHRNFRRYCAVLYNRVTTERAKK